MSTGRRSKLTPDVHQAIVGAVRSGVPVVQAAKLVDIRKETVLEWLRRGTSRDHRPATTPYATFAHDIEKAEAVDEGARIARLNAAARGGGKVTKTLHYPDGRIEVEERTLPPIWQIDAWFLERRFPDRYGRKLQADLSLRIQQAAQEVADEVGVPIQAILDEAQRYLREADQHRRR